MRSYLGVEPQHDGEGCLQDVHWSAGLFGYFPTYTLGNIFSAQLMDAVTAQIGDQSAAFASGRYGSLLHWLRENIHRHGQRYRARELMQKVTGQPLSVVPLLNHLRQKAAIYYGV